MYEEILDDCEDEVMIAGIRFSPSYILKQLDPTAYRLGVLDLIDSIDEEDDPESLKEMDAYLLDIIEETKFDYY
jgi:hypothetical protein